MSVTPLKVKLRTVSAGEILDGKDPVRPHQVTAINEIIAALQTADVVGANFPPGYGKSYIARALQRMICDTDIITANNALIDQYKRDYPELNVVKGKDHYATLEAYEKAKRLARSSAPSIFNPLSALFTRSREVLPAKCIIVDEAHALGDMLRHAASVSFNASKSGISQRCTSDYALIKWAKERFSALSERMAREPLTPPLQREYEKIAAIYYSVVGHEQDSVFNIHRTYGKVKGRRFEVLTVDAVDYPYGLIRQVLNADKVILMSGTLTKSETEELAVGRSFTWLSRPYLAPPENRPVFIQPVEMEDRKDFAKLSDKIRRIYTSRPLPMIVHVSYGEQKEYLKHLQGLPVLVNTSKNKGEIIEKFKEVGGILLAAGCAEGIDLPDDYCRTIIVPTLQFPNKGDMYVQKRLGRPDGQRWYALKTLENTVQRLGRGVRHIGDHCEHYIFDPWFPILWNTHKSEFEPLSIIWGKE